MMINPIGALALILSTFSPGPPPRNPQASPCAGQGQPAAAAEGAQAPTLTGRAIDAGVPSGKVEQPKPEPKPTAKRKRAPGEILRRGFFTASGGYQPTANAFTRTTTWAVYAEDAKATASYQGGGGFLFDAGGGIAVWRDLAVGGALSYLARTVSAPAIVQIPKPFDYDAARTAAAEAPGLSRSDVAVHVQLAWFTSLTRSRRLQLAVAGGPSMVRVRQVVVSGALFNDAYPYNTLTVTAVTTSAHYAWGPGANVQADVTWMLSRRVGVGGLMRWWRAVATLQTGTDSVKVNAGGVQAMAGIRARF